MKRILGLDLGTTSIGWALVNEAEDNRIEQSSIVRMGVRVTPLTVDESTNFEKGKPITINAERTLKRSMRRNLQRYKLRRDNLIGILKVNQFISDETLLSENGNHTTFETYRLRAKAAKEKISLEELARVFFMINKKRGYKSSRKVKSAEEGQLVDGMSVAKKLYEEDLTPGQFVYLLLKEGKKINPDFYISDLQAEFDRIWNKQQEFYPDLLTEEFRKQLVNKGKKITAKLFLSNYNIYTAENKGSDKLLQAYGWRVKALSEQLTDEELAFVIAQLNGLINNSSGYLGAISDRSKELYFNKQTVGEYLTEMLDKDPNISLKNRVFYRQDYLDEFNTIWDTQAKHHEILTDELKKELRDIIIFYQRRLKSQKGLISICELEGKEIEIEIGGKKKTKMTGPRVIPRSSPLFQEFKIWQILNNVQVLNKKEKVKRFLEQGEKESLFEELNIREKITKEQALKFLYENDEELDLNFQVLEGNTTQAELINKYQSIIELSGYKKSDIGKLTADKAIKFLYDVFAELGYNTDILSFDSDAEDLDKQPMYRFWHLLYSFEGDNSNTGNERLINKLIDSYGFDQAAAVILANTTFKNDDYGSLSAKAIRKILPHLKEGHEYSKACEFAGYRHSKKSLTKEEVENKSYKDRLELLPKNSLRNPVVEKILNQMTNVVNSIIETYGKPDEIRIELARGLKKSAKEREELTNIINKTTAEHEKFRSVLQKDFGLSCVSRNDIIRYKLYLELESNGFCTLYSNTYISPGKLFSKEFDIEHIIPQSRLFDDSFSNKTLELSSINREKGSLTACDYILNKYGEKGLEEYLIRLDALFGKDIKKRNKLGKLKMKEVDIPDGFIERDIRDTQYIARKAKEILEGLVKSVVSTSGLVTARLREDWQLIDVMKELNWDKYDKFGLTEIVENKDGQKIYHIKDWSKRNDHRHHAMDALTVAFTKRSFIQYLNNLNGGKDKDVSFSRDIYGIQKKELYRDKYGKMKFNPPLPLDIFRSEAKKQLKNILISIKAKNKVVTPNSYKTKRKGGFHKKIQLTPRTQLHNETVYGTSCRYVIKEEKVGSGFNEEYIKNIAKKKYREALLDRLKMYGNDPKKAFTGKNSLQNNPLWLNELHTEKVPEKVKTVTVKTLFTIRKEVTPDLKLDKVMDTNIRRILQQRLEIYNNDPKKAFSNLDENPIWLNQSKGIAIKRVTITGISNGEPLHRKKDKNGNLILDENGKTLPVDFVSTSNNHHVAIYRDANDNLQEDVVSYYKVLARINAGLPIIDREYKKSEGWVFLYTMKQNEYFVFPNKDTRFNPDEIDLLDPDNYSLISLNLFRVQKFTIKDYFFRHHLETSVENNNALKGITWKRCGLNGIENIVKVRINHIGEIVSVGEY